MAIPESQLAAWALQGPVERARITYASVRSALAPVGELGSTEIYLHGPFGSGTNVRTDSRLEVIAQLNAPRPDSGTFIGFRRAAISALQSEFGLAALTEGSRAVGLSARMPVEILPCMKHGDGIWFETRSGDRITDYPQLHLANGEVKDVATGGLYRKMVRVFKNVRNNLSENGALDRRSAPTRFIESLLWNVPDEKYSGALKETFVGCVNWLWSAELPALVRQDGKIPIFGREFAPERANRFLEAATNLWDGW